MRPELPGRARRRAGLHALGLAALVLCRPAVADPAAAGDERSQRQIRAQAYHHFTMGTLLADDGNFEAALRELSKAARLDAASAEIHTELARVYLKSGEADKAIAAAREAVERAGQDAEAHRSLAEALTAASFRRDAPPELLGEAIREYRRVAELGGGDAETLMVLGRLEMQGEQNERAIDTFRRAAEIGGETVAARLHLARALMRAGRSEEAIAEYREVLDRAPRQFEALASLATLLEQSQRWLEAAEAYEELIDVRPADGSVRFRYGICMLRGGRPDEAVEPLRAAVEMSSGSTTAVRALAMALRRSGRPTEALENYRRLLQEAPGDFFLLAETAYVHESRGERDRAIELLDRSLEAGMASPELKEAALDVAFELAGLRVAREEGPEALAVVDKIMALGGGDRPETALLRCRALLLAGEHDRVVREAAEARVRFSGDYRFRLIEAEAAAAAGDLRAAEMDVAEAVREAGGSRESVLRVAEFWTRRGQAHRALELLEQAAGARPGDDVIWFELGGAMERAGRPERAAAALRRAIAINAANHLALNYLGYMLAERGESLDEAQGLIERAVSLEPHNGAYLDSLGWVLYRKGRAAEALPHLQRAAELLAGDSTVREHLGDVLAEVGRWSEAKNEWRRARELGGPVRRLEAKIRRAERERSR